MIAATRRRIGAALLAAGKRSRQLDRALARRIERLRPPLARRLTRLRALASGAGDRLRRLAARAARLVWRLARPALVLLLRGFALLERLLLATGSRSARAATAASAALTPRRAVCAATLGAAACLLAAQFVEYRSVEVGQAAYAGLPAAAAPTVGGETPSDAHSFALVVLALAAAATSLLALRPGRLGLARVTVALGAASLAVILLVDLPAGLATGAQAARFSGASAVLEDGFFAELAAAAGLVIGGLLYYARPCRIRISSSGRAASARRRRRRRRDSSPRRAARRPSPPPSGAASAPASQR